MLKKQHLDRLIIEQSDIVFFQIQIFITKL